MPRIYLCFLWHMHQPFYKDLVSGSYQLPWTRLHALKDYYGMVRLLDEFPTVRQTFNLVPSMLVQVAEYASGTALEPFLEAAIKPAANLTETDESLILQNFFHANPERMIHRYPRYGELYDARFAHADVFQARRAFSTQDYRDLQILSQVAWFDEEFLEGDAAVRGLIAKGRDFSAADQALMARKQLEILGRVIPAYREAALAGRIEISTTPFYHPILPLLCDSAIASTSHPHVPLPRRFRYPQDAALQIEMARDFTLREFGSVPAGMWPSEGSVSDEALRLASEAGFTWTATDSGELDRTLGRGSGVDALYRPYVWRQGEREIRVIFRDHFLSDLIGFVYSAMDPAHAAADFLARIRANCTGLLTSGRDALVPIILDGENAWEYYERNGRAFLRELYRRISEDAQMSAVTVHEALQHIDPAPLGGIFPGSWINANFDVWIGAEEDNRAWELLLDAREAFDTARGVSEDKLSLAREELLIAEGSDWCWWYGPEHDSPNRVDFDRLYRSHLANVYHALGKRAPEELSRPILTLAIAEFHAPPTAAIQPVIDGEVSSYFEWMGAGLYRLDMRTGAMHGRRFLVRELFYGASKASVFLRLDFTSAPEELTPAIEIRLRFTRKEAASVAEVTIQLENGRATASVAGVTCSCRQILEIAVPLASLGLAPDGPVRFQASLWQGGLPLGAIPQQGWIELATATPDIWPV